MFFDVAIIKEALRMLKDSNDISEMDEAAFSSRADITSFDGSILKMAVPSKFYLDRFKGSFQSKMEQAISDIEGTDVKILFSIKEKNYSANEQVVEITKVASYHDIAIKSKKERPRDLQLSYTFDTFVPGENSNFALGVSRWIAEHPDGTKYNPCLIFGGVGLGKTHLLKSIGNYIYDHDPTLNIKYITARQMYEDVSHYAAQGKHNEYRLLYDDLDVLLIDDIHVLEKKASTQEILYHSMDILYNKKKPIVFTCDRPITELKNVTPRLISRFSKSTIVDLQPPEFETKRAIIKKKLEMKGKEFPDEVIELIAKSIQNSVRELESAIDSLEAYSEMTGKTITIELARLRLRTQLQNSSFQGSMISIALVQKIIADYFGISTQDLKGKKKTKSIVYPRQLAMYIIRQITEFSTSEIGIEFGGRDHSTVMHSCDKIDNLRKSDPREEATIQNLIRAVREQNGNI